MAKTPYFLGQKKVLFYTKADDKDSTLKFYQLSVFVKGTFMQVM